MAKFLTLDDVEVKDKVVLVRVDFNSPIDPETKKILDDSRIRAHGESTIKELAEKGAKVVVLAHQGRKGDPDFIPLEQHAEILAKVLGKPVKYVDDLYGEKAKEAIKELKSGEVLVLENVRMFDAETEEGTPEEQAKKPLVVNLAPLARLVRKRRLFSRPQSARINHRLHNRVTKCCRPRNGKRAYVLEEDSGKTREAMLIYFRRSKSR